MPEAFPEAMARRRRRNPFPTRQMQIDMPELRPELPEGKIQQLSNDNGSWKLVAEHEIFDWLGYTRLHPGWVFRDGEDLLVMDASPVYDGFYIPKMTVLRMVLISISRSKNLTWLVSSYW